MKVKMNFKVDTLTLNGHIYPKEVLKKALDERKDKGNFLFINVILTKLKIYLLKL